MKQSVNFEAWGLHSIWGGALALGNHGLASLAAEFGTPLHVINEGRLMKNASAFREEAERAYPGRVAVCYAMKCNSVPAVVDAVLRTGPGLEVMTEYELELALRLGCPPDKIIVNGPCKTPAFIEGCIDARVRLIVVDSIAELQELDGRSLAHRTRSAILLRVNPDFIPRGMNRGTATGSRRGCAFGLDLKGGEVRTALSLLGGLEGIAFLGFHMHIGTGIRRPSDYARALRCLGTLKKCAREAGFHIRVLDVGGGYASPMTRELGTVEFLLSQVFGPLREGAGPKSCGTPRGFVRAISKAVTERFGPEELPELVFEPGRCIAGPAQFLLLTVHNVKVRPGAGRWLIADGGLSTVTLPTFYEHHEVLLCNDVFRGGKGRATIIGPACFAGDVVYRNKRMPPVSVGEVIALMDTGAYFTALESSFGFPRPAIVSLNGATCRLVRTRETFDEMICRDIFD